VDEHDVADDERVPLMPAQRAGRERPGHLQLADVVRGDLVQRAETLQVVGPAGHDPLVAVIRHRRQLVGRRRLHRRGLRGALRRGALRRASLRRRGERRGDGRGDGQPGGRERVREAIHSQLRSET
jgi:hypothetical protein